MEIQEKIRDQYVNYPYPSIRDDPTLTLGRWKTCLRKMVGALEGKFALDVGCGTGWITLRLAKLGMKVVGIDLSSESIRLARRRAESLDIDATFEVADLFTYSTSNRFDLVICTGVLHHTSRPFKGFQRLASFVTNGGYLFVSLYSNCHLRFRIIDWLVRNRFAQIQEQLSYVKAHPYLFSLIALTDVRKSQEEWIVDTFCNVHRSYHTVGEVRGWMKHCGIDYIGLVKLWRIPFLGMINSVMHYFTVVGRKSVTDKRVNI